MPLKIKPRKVKKEEKSNENAKKYYMNENVIYIIIIIVGIIIFNNINIKNNITKQQPFNNLFEYLILKLKEI